MPVTVTPTHTAHETATAVHTAAKTPTPATGDILSRIAHSIGISPEMLAVALFVIVTPLFVIALTRLLSRATGIVVGRQLPFIFYDPGSHAFKWAMMLEVAPNVFTNQEGTLIALVSSQARPVNITRLPLDKRLRGYSYAFYGHRLGSAVLSLDPYKEFMLSTTKTIVEPVPVHTLADLLVQLYTSNMLSGEVKVNPSMRLVLVVDNSKAGELLAKSYGQLVEEALIDVASLTGKRKDFEQQLKAMYQLEQRKLESLTGSVAKILGLVLVMLIIMAFLLKFLGGGH